MKKLLTILAVVLSVAMLVSCGTDDTLNVNGDADSTVQTDAEDGDTTVSTDAPQGDINSPWPDDTGSPWPEETQPQEVESEPDIPTAVTEPDVTEPEATTPQQDSESEATEPEEEDKPQATEPVNGGEPEENEDSEENQVDEGDDEDVADLGWEDINVDEFLASLGIDTDDLEIDE